MNRDYLRFLLAPVIAVAALAAQSGQAQAAPPAYPVRSFGQFTEYTIPSGANPNSITAGADGNLWFTEPSANRIGRITLGGVITEYAVLTTNSYPYTIAAGPDGNVWFTELFANKIGRITPNGVITEWPVPSGTYVDGITAGPNNSMWFAGGDSSGSTTTGFIGQITAGGSISLLSLGTAYHVPGKIAAGSDGQLWFTDNNSQDTGCPLAPHGPRVPPLSGAAPEITVCPQPNIIIPDHIGRINTAGTFAQSNVVGSQGDLDDITAGPDGALWYSVGSLNAGRITTAPATTRFAVPGASSWLRGVTSGPDGNIWFADQGANAIAYYNTTPTYLGSFTIPTASSGVTDLVRGGDNSIWFTEYSTGKIGRLDLGYPTITPTPTNTLPPTLTYTPTRTWTPVPPTNTYTSTPTRTWTPVPPTNTYTATATRTSIPLTATPTRTAGPTNTVPVGSTNTPTPSVTRTTAPTSTNTPIGGGGGGGGTATLTPGGSTPTVVPSGVWFARAFYPIPIADSAVVAQGGYLYSFGGRTTGNMATNAAYRYNPTTNSWTTLAVLPEALSDASAMSDGTYIYLFNGGLSSAHAYRYDPAGNGYTQLPSAPMGTYAQGGVWLDGKIYRIAGMAGSATTDTVDVYNPATNSWAAGPAYPYSTYFLTTATLNGSIYGAGGAGSFDLEKTYRLDPATGTWDDAGVPDLPNTRWGATSGALDGKWLLAGGNENGTVTNSALLWTGVAGEGWQPIAPMLVARHRVGGAAINSTFYAVGGEDALNHAPTNDVQAYLDPCPIQFGDVTASDYFYTPVLYLACHGVLGGYADGTFRPYNNTTRGQLAKIVVGGEGWATDTTGGPHFSDVPADSTFYNYIETAFNHGVIGGYADGTFRPGNNVTRGQLSKIIVLAQGWATDTTGGPHFSDVAVGSTFYDAIETAVNHGIINGYNDGTFRPANPATRGQISKIVYRALTGATFVVAK